MINRNLHSPTKLTEFARDFENEPDTFLNKVVQKITNAYNSSYNSVNINPNAATNIERDAERSGSARPDRQNEHSSGDRTDEEISPTEVIHVSRNSRNAIGNICY